MKNNWLNEVKKEIKVFHNTEYAKLSDGRINQRIAASEFSTGRKMSEEAKNKLSKALSNKPKTNSHKKSLKKAKLKYKITKEEILKAQVGTTTAKEVADTLGIDFHTYKNIATYHGVYKKQSLVDRNKIISAISILCFDYASNNFLKEYNSIADAARELQLQTSNIVSVCKGKYKQTGGYRFEYKK